MFTVFRIFTVKQQEMLHWLGTNSRSSAYCIRKVMFSRVFSNVSRMYDFPILVHFIITKSHREASSQLRIRYARKYHWKLVTNYEIWMNCVASLIPHLSLKLVLCGKLSWNCCLFSFVLDVLYGDYQSSWPPGAEHRTGVPPLLVSTLVSPPLSRNSSFSGIFRLDGKGWIVQIYISAFWHYIYLED